MSRPFEVSDDKVEKAGRATMVLQAFSILLIAILAALFIVTMHRYETLQSSVSEDALWAITQFDRETRKLSREMTGLILNPAPDDEARDAVSVKYDIVYSRLNMLKSGQFDRHFAADAPSDKLVAQITAIMLSIRGVFDRMAAGEAVSREELLAASDSIENALDQSELLVGIGGNLRASGESEDRTILLRLQVVSAFIAAALLICILTLIILLHRQIGSIRAAKEHVETVAANLRDQVDQAVGDVRAREEEIIERLSTAAGHKDVETELHTKRVAAYAEAVADAYGFEKDASHDIRLASLMHDIGKVSIPDAILQKAGRLTEAEFGVMKTHTVVGGEILKESSAPLLQLASQIARSHHERWDGAGYPDGLKGGAIPLPGRIVALADNFDALTTVRVYKSAWSIESAIKHIKQNAGLQFDPDCVKAFEAALPKILEIRESLMEPEDQRATGRG